MDNYVKCCVSIIIRESSLVGLNNINWLRKLTLKVNFTSTHYKNIFTNLTYCLLIAQQISRKYFLLIILNTDPSEFR